MVSEGSPAALADPVDHPQPLDGRGVVSAAVLGLVGGGTGAGLAVRRQPLAVAALVELGGRLELATARAALDRGHAAVPSGW
jgi:hypothetical protein